MRYGTITYQMAQNIIYNEISFISHNPEVAGSSPVPATNKERWNARFQRSFRVLTWWLIEARRILARESVRFFHPKFRKILPTWIDIAEIYCTQLTSREDWEMWTWWRSSRIFSQVFCQKNKNGKSFRIFCRLWKRKIKRSIHKAALQGQFGSAEDKNVCFAKKL